MRRWTVWIPATSTCSITAFGWATSGWPRKSGLHQMGWEQQPCSGKPDADHLNFLWLLALQQTQSSQNNRVSFFFSSQTNCKNILASVGGRDRKTKNNSSHERETYSCQKTLCGHVGLRKRQSFLIKQYCTAVLNFSQHVDIRTNSTIDANVILTVH